jgi:hypothetical protein
VGWSTSLAATERRLAGLVVLGDIIRRTGNLVRRSGSLGRNNSPLIGASGTSRSSDMRVTRELNVRRDGIVRADEWGRADSDDAEGLGVERTGRGCKCGRTTTRVRSSRRHGGNWKVVGEEDKHGRPARYLYKTACDIVSQRPTLNSRRLQHAVRRHLDVPPFDFTIQSSSPRRSRRIDGLDRLGAE